MANETIQVLLVEDNPADARLIGEMLAHVDSPRISVHHVDCLDKALGCLDKSRFDLVLLDLSLPNAQGLDALNQAQRLAPQMPMVVLTGLGDQELALKAVQEGAQDFLVKGHFEQDLLACAMRYAIERAQILGVLKQAHDDLEDQIRERTAELAQANEALRKFNEELETRVLERTTELTAINADLRREIEERKRAEAELMRRNRELLSLQAALAATASSLDQQFVLDTVTWEMASLFAAEGCTIFEWDQQTNNLSIIAEFPYAGWHDSKTVPQGARGDPLKLLALQERRAHQMTSSQAHADSAGRSYMESLGFKTLLILPVVFQDRVVGLVEVADRRVERTFTDHEISVAQLLASQAASALENARLYEQAQQEIARRTLAEERITASLKEKEVLLKEIHHRVKNNLQVISSLLYLQSTNVTDPEVLAKFQDSQNRVRSMALIHERLYQTGDLARINFAEYARDLTDHLLRTYSIEPGSIALKVDADDTALSVDIALSCGLILNELVSNSLKYAFPGHGRAPADKPAGAGGAPGEEHATPSGDEHLIQIELRSKDKGYLHLRVADNGVGFPQDIDFRSTKSLGLQLVNALVTQLDGTIELQGDGGTEFSIVLNTR